MQLCVDEKDAKESTDNFIGSIARDNIQVTLFFEAPWTTVLQWEGDKRGRRY